MQLHHEKLSHLFYNCFGYHPLELSPIDAHASARHYVRLHGKTGFSVIGCFSAEQETNQGFIRIAKILSDASIPCPQIYGVDDTGVYYLQSDMGSETVFEYLKRCANDTNDSFIPSITLPILEQCLYLAATMQYKIPITITETLPLFSSDRIQRDLDNFKNKFADPLFGSLSYHYDFEQIINWYQKIPRTLYRFMHRDYQLRNIMMGESLSVIDFQNAMHGPILYDVASLLFSSSISISDQDREQLINRYKKYFEQLTGELLPHDFSAMIYMMALPRTLQALGAYGNAVLLHHKTQLIPAMKRSFSNLKTILHLIRDCTGLTFPTLELLASKPLPLPSTLSKLPISIQSFSYRIGIPEFKKHHVNFLFDARTFHNPGRYANFAGTTGHDNAVTTYLSQYPEYSLFLESITTALQNVLKSDYDYSAPLTQISIYVGCTGGRHRSVAIVDFIANFLSREMKRTVTSFHPHLQ